MTDPQTIAEGMTRAQRHCGDLLDSLPCVECGAPRLGQCPLPPSAKIPVRDLINDTPGLGNILRAEVKALRTHLEKESKK